MKKLATLLTVSIAATAFSGCKPRKQNTETQVKEVSSSKNPANYGHITEALRVLVLIKIAEKLGHTPASLETEFAGNPDLDLASVVIPTGMADNIGLTAAEFSKENYVANTYASKDPLGAIAGGLTKVSTVLTRWTVKDYQDHNTFYWKDDQGRWNWATFRIAEFIDAATDGGSAPNVIGIAVSDVGIPYLNLKASSVLENNIDEYSLPYSYVNNTIDIPVENVRRYLQSQKPKPLNNND